MDNAYLGVPDSFIEPLGRLAITAGRLETNAALICRVFLRPLPAAMQIKLINNATMHRLRDLISSFTDNARVHEIDAGLHKDMQAWAKGTEPIAKARNTWLHASWASNFDGSVISAVSPTNRTVTATDADAIMAVVHTGRGLVTESQFLLDRTRRVVSDDRYSAPRPTSFPEWVEPL